MNIRAVLVTLPVQIKADFEDDIYRNYTTTALQFLNENIAEAWGGKKLKYSYYDLINGKVEEEDNRSGDEIVDEVLGLICGKEKHEPI